MAKRMRQAMLKLQLVKGTGNTEKSTREPESRKVILHNTTCALYLDFLSLYKLALSSSRNPFIFSKFWIMANFSSAFLFFFR